jgi:hypothetical protein
MDSLGRFTRTTRETKGSEGLNGNPEKLWDDNWTRISGVVTEGSLRRGWKERKLEIEGVWSYERDHSRGWDKGKEI